MLDRISEDIVNLAPIEAPKQRGGYKKKKESIM
jgi:hypothetical protein